jgi:hypothetical protein
MRLELGLTLDEGAKLLDKTRSALGRIEKAETIADVHLVRSAMDVYQAYDPDVIELAREAARPGWWRAYGVRDHGFIGLETAAARSLETALVRLPSLLQTADYTRALLSSACSTWSRGQIERECAVRSIRQKRLTDEDGPLELSVIMDESALRKPIGGPVVMRRQLHHLVDMAERDTTSILVVPDELGAHPGMGGAFTVLEFQDDADPDTLSVQYAASSMLIDKRDEVDASKYVFNDLRSMTLSPSESLEFMKNLTVERYEK